MTSVDAGTTRIAPPERIYRHRLLTRVTHWINLLCLTLLLMSGLQIFNAHPRLYWGQAGANFDKAFIEMRAYPDGRGGLMGVTRIGPLTLETTGVLGASNERGQAAPRGFPTWSTLPSYRDLGTGRRWHFFAAWLFVINGAAYLGHGLASGHFRRDLALRRDELRPRSLFKDICDHARFRHPTGEAARRYNSLQKIAYLSIIIVLLPLMLGTGLTMSPGMNAAAPWLLDLFGGRQSARSLHFISAGLIVGFVVVHVAEVFIAGVWNEMRSMITGWYVVRPEAPHEKP